jgi:hypothetical protein
MQKETKDLIKIAATIYFLPEILTVIGIVSGVLVISLCFLMMVGVCCDPPPRKPTTNATRSQQQIVDYDPKPVISVIPQQKTVTPPIDSNDAVGAVDRYILRTNRVTPSQLSQMDEADKYKIINEEQQRYKAESEEKFRERNRKNRP